MFPSKTWCKSLEDEIFKNPILVPQGKIVIGISIKTTFHSRLE